MVTLSACVVLTAPYRPDQRLNCFCASSSNALAMRLISSGWLQSGRWTRAMGSRGGVAGVREYFRRHDRMRSFEPHLQTVHSVSWNCDGRRLATGSVDKNVCVSNLDNHRLVWCEPSRLTLETSIAPFSWRSSSTDYDERRQTNRLDPAFSDLIANC